MSDYRQIITIEPGKRGGRPCIRGLRIAVADVLGWLAAGLSHEEIKTEFPEIGEEDIGACLAYAADRERRRRISRAFYAKEPASFSLSNGIRKPSIETRAPAGRTLAAQPRTSL